MPTYDQPASDADIRTLLAGHRLTAAFPVLHDDLVARLQAGGVRRIGGAYVMPCGTPPGVWLDEFVRAVQRDFLLDNTAGAAFVLGNCEKRTLTGEHSGTVETVLRELAVRAFADVLAL